MTLFVSHYFYVNHIADKVAESIYSLMEIPKAEVFINPATPEIARRYCEDVDALDRNMLKGE